MEADQGLARAGCRFGFLLTVIGLFELHLELLEELAVITKLAEHTLAVDVVNLILLGLLGLSILFSTLLILVGGPGLGGLAVKVKLPVPFLEHAEGN